jgi:branched-chain amino acid transport system substrate-binding protein
MALGLATMMVAAAACGDDDDDDSAATTASAAATTQASATSSGATSASSTPASSTTPAEPKGTVKVGFINPLSGQFAAVGTSFQQGLELYLEEHDNTLGGYEVDLVTVDEGAGASEAVPVARKLIQQDEVDVVTGVVSSATAAAVFPMFEQATTPVVFAQGFPTPQPEPDPSKFLWATGANVPPYAVGMAHYLFENVDNTKGVYFIAADYIQGHAFVDLAKAKYAELGGKVAGEAFPPLGTTLDYQPFLSQIEDSGAAAVYAFFGGSDAVRFVQQYSEFGLTGTIPLYSSTSLVTGANLEAQGDAAIGVIVNGHYAVSLDNPENEAFVAAFEAKFGAEPDNFAMQQYDALAVIDQALSTLDGDIDHDALADALSKVGTVPSPRGEWELDSTYHVPRQRMYVFEIGNGADGVGLQVVEELPGLYDPRSGEPA